MMDNFKLNNLDLSKIESKNMNNIIILWTFQTIKLQVTECLTSITIISILVTLKDAVQLLYEHKFMVAAGDYE